MLTPPVEAALALKVAVTLFAAVMLTVHDPVPAQAPDHPAKVEPEAGDALIVTFAPLVNVELHVEPQLIAAGAEVTVPLPEPMVTVESAKEPGVGVVDGVEPIGGLPTPSSVSAETAAALLPRTTRS
jgi:hypothetical protein